MHTKKLIVEAIIAIVAFLFCTAPVLADTVSSNFEQPTYVLGNINGQDGWTKGGFFEAEVVNNVYGLPSFGSQSLRIADLVTSSSYVDQTYSKSLNDAVGEVDSTAGAYSAGNKQRHFEMQFEFASTKNVPQVGMHVSVLPERGDGSPMSYLRFEDQVDGIHVYFQDVTDAGPVGTFAIFKETQIAFISRDAHKFRLTMDTLDGPSNDVVKVYVDGTLRITGTSWENYYRYDPAAALEQSPRIIKNVVIKEDGTANPGDHHYGFLFDNLVLSSGPVPTPSPTPVPTPVPTPTPTPVPTATPSPTPAGVTLTNWTQCLNNGWKRSTNPAFKSQTACLKYFNH